MYFYAFLLDKNQLHEGNMAQSYCNIYIYIYILICSNLSTIINPDKKFEPVRNQPIQTKHRVPSKLRTIHQDKPLYYVCTDTEKWKVKEKSPILHASALHMPEPKNSVFDDGGNTPYIQVSNPP